MTFGCARLALGKVVSVGVAFYMRKTYYCAGCWGDPISRPCMMTNAIPTAR